MTQNLEARDCLKCQLSITSKMAEKGTNLENGISFFLLIQFNIPFKIIYSYLDEPIGRWGETGVPRENHLTHPQAELGLSHMWPARGSNLHQSQR